MRLPTSDRGVLKAMNGVPGTGEPNGEYFVHLQTEENKNEVAGAHSRRQMALQHIFISYHDI